MKNFTKQNFKQFTSRLSARWLIMALMLLVGTSSAWAATWTVYFVNKDKWSTVKIHHWKDGGSSTSWPGEDMKKTEYLVDGHDVYSFTTNNDHNKCIFNNGSGTQTGDLAINNGKYYYDGKGWVDHCTSCCTNYYVAGDEGLCGEAWNANADLMTCDNNIWTKTFTNINNGTYYFQITNGTWNVKKGDYDNSKGNITLSNVDDGYGAKKIKLTTTSKGNITISFDGTKAWVDFEQPCYSSSDVEPGTISSNATNNTICGSGTVELTLSNTTTKDGLTKSIQWQKQSGNTWPDINNANSTTYTAENLSATTTYRAKVTWTKTGCDNIVEYANVTVTVNALPSAPTFTTNSAQVCSGVAFNLNEKFPRNSGEAGTLTWYKTSDDSQVTDPASVTITEATSYYAKATNNNCTSGKSFDCTVNVDAKPILELASTPTVCPNVEIDLDNYVTSNTGTLTWYSNQERTTVITDGLVTPTERTTYYAKVINGTCNPVENEFTVDVYGIADEMPAYTSTPATSCKGTPNSDGSIALKNTIGYITYTLDGKEGDSNVWTGLSVGTHKLAATINTCPSITKEWDVVVEVEDITPDATVSITGDDSFCEGGNTILTSVVTATQGEVTAYQWYNGEELIQGATASTYTANAAGSYKVVVTVKNKGCEDTFNATKEVSVKNKPTTPEFNPDFTSICDGGSTTLASDYNWYTELNASALVDLTVSPQTTTTYYATKVENGCTSDAGEFTVTVNPLPRITSISASNDKPVLFEDVELTANNVTDGAQVKWYVEENLVAENTNTYIVTSDEAGEVIVKAKAFLNGCESAVASHTVVFSAETCNNVADMTKIYLDVSENTGFITGNNAYVSVTASGNNSANCDNTSGANQNNYVPKNDTWWGTMTKVAGENYIYEITIPNNVTINKGTTKLSFWNKSISSNSDVWEVQAILGQTISAGTNCMKLSNKTKTHNDDRHSHLYCGTWTTYANKPVITTPAVKTVSVETEPGEGNIIFEGQVVKTGCAETLTYGFAYSTNANADKSTWTKVQCTNVGNTVGTLFSGSKTELEDGTYYVCAYITNSFGTSFGEAKEKELTTSTEPVRTAEIKLVNQDGTSTVEPGHKYCVGETAYIKVESGDVKYSTATWKSDLGVEVEQIGKTNIYQFEVKGKDQIVVLLSNKHNTEPVSSEPQEVEVYASPSVPEIALGASSICNTNVDGTTLTVTRTKSGQYYALYKEDGNGGIEVEDYQLCTSDNAEIKYTGLKEAAKYFVKTYRGECDSEITRSSSATLTVVDSKDVNISIEPTGTETTPWMPVKLTVTATSDYTVTSEPNDAVIKISGNIVKVKLPLPTEGVENKGTTEDDVNVTFEDVPYTITAELKTAGEEGNPCAQPAIANITLKPYIEICD